MLSNKVSILFITRILQVVISFATLKVSMKFLSPEEMGKFFIFVTSISMVCFSVLGPVGQYAQRMVHEWKNQARVYSDIKAITKLFFMVAAVYAFIILVLSNFIDHFSSYHLIVLFLIILFGVFANSASAFLPSVINILGQYQHFALLYGFNTLAIFIFSITFVYFGQADATFWIGGKIVGQLLTAIIAFYVFKKIFCKDDNKRLSFNKLEMLNYSYPLGITAIMVWLQGEGYRFIVEKYAGLEYLGLLAIGLSFATRITSIVETLAQQIVFPDFYKGLSESQKIEETWQRMFDKILPVYIGTAFLIAVNAPFIMKILGTDQYFSAYKFIVYGACIELFRVISNLIVQVFHAHKKTKKLIKPYIASVICFLALIFYSSLSDRELIPLSLVLAGFISLVAMWYFSNKIQKIQLNFTSIFICTLYFSVLSVLLFFWGKNPSYTMSFCCGALSTLYYLFGLKIFYKK